MIDWFPPQETENIPSLNREFQGQKHDPPRGMVIIDPSTQIGDEAVDPPEENQNSFCLGLKNLSNGTNPFQQRGNEYPLSPPAECVLDALSIPENLVKMPMTGVFNTVSSLVTDAKNGVSFTSTIDYGIGIGKNLVEAPFHIIGGTAQILGGAIQGIGYLTQWIPIVGEGIGWFGTNIAKGGTVITSVVSDTEEPQPHKPPSSPTRSSQSKQTRYTPDCYL